MNVYTLALYKYVRFLILQTFKIFYFRSFGFSILFLYSMYVFSIYFVVSYCYKVLYVIGVSSLYYRGGMCVLCLVGVGVF